MGCTIKNIRMKHEKLLSLLILQILKGDETSRPVNGVIDIKTLSLNTPPRRAPFVNIT